MNVHLAGPSPLFSAVLQPTLKCSSSTAEPECQTSTCLHVFVFSAGVTQEIVNFAVTFFSPVGTLPLTQQQHTSNLEFEQQYEL